MSCRYLVDGIWVEKDELSDVLNGTTEQDMINNNTGPVEYSLSIPSTANPTYANPIVGYYAKFIAQKQTSLRKYENRLETVKSLRNRKSITATELTKLATTKRGLEEEIDGLKNELAQLSAKAQVNAVGYYVEKDLERLSKLANSSNVDDLLEADRLIQFYTDAGTFIQRQDNPFFEEKDIFFPGTTDYALPQDVMDTYADWKNRAIGYQNIVDHNKRNLTTNLINTDINVKRTYGKTPGFTFDDITSADTGLKDTHFVDMWIMDITKGIWSHNGILPQASYSYLTNLMSDKLVYAEDFAHRTDVLNPKVIKELKDLKQTLKAAGIIGPDAVTYQLFKEITKDGNETGGIIQKYVRSFLDGKQKANDDFQKAFNAARAIQDTTLKNAAIKKAFNDQRTWRRKNTIIMEIDRIPEITSDPEFAQFITVPHNNDHKDQLLKILGQKEYTKQVEEQKRLLRKYISEKQSKTEELMVDQGITDPLLLSQQNLLKLERWDKASSPQDGIRDYFSVNYGANIDNYNTFNIAIPRRYETTAAKTANGQALTFSDTNVLTGHYNETFEKYIEPSKNLSDFHDLLMDAATAIREIMPVELKDQLTFNSLPSLLKTSAEIIADKSEQTSILRRMFEGFAHLWEKVRLGFGVNQQSELSTTVRDPKTGKANYRVNDEFLRGNSRAVNTRMTLEKTKFIQAYNRTAKSKITDIKRFTVLDFKNMNDEAKALLVDYLNLKNPSEIRARLGSDVVDIGRIIRDYSLHTVVQSQSFDLAKLVKYTTHMAMLYAARTEALPTLEVMKKHYESIKAPVTNNVSRRLIDSITGKVVQSGTRANAASQYEDWFGRVPLDNYSGKHTGAYNLGKNSLIGEKIYTREERREMAEITKLIANETEAFKADQDTAHQDKIKELQNIMDNMGKLRTLTAAFNQLLGWIRTLRLGYNISSSMTNLLEGYASNMLVAAGGQYFESKQIYYAYKVVKYSFLKNSTFGKVEHHLAKKNRILMDKYRVLQDSKNELQKSSVRTYSDRFESLNPHTINARVEFINQSAMMVASLRTVKIKDSNGVESRLWDAYESDGTLKPAFRTQENIENWEQLKGEDYKNFKSNLSNAITVGHGNYDELKGMKIKSTTGGKAMMMFKTWLPQQLYWRFAIQQDDILSGIKGFKGRYRSYGTGSGALAGAVSGGLIMGLPGAAIGALAGGILGKAAGTPSDVTMMREILTSIKVMLKKAVGMPFNTFAGGDIIDTSGKEFDSWVKGGQFTQQDANALKSNMSDLAMTLTFMALMLATKSMFYDEDDDANSPQRRAHNILMNRLMQLADQANMYINLVDMWKSMVGDNAVWKYLGDVKKEGERFGKLMQGEDILSSGENAGQSGFKVQTKKILLPGMFRDGGVFGDMMEGKVPTLGFESQMKRQFQPSPLDHYFKSEEKLDKEHNKGERAALRAKLKDQGIDDKEVEKQVDAALPTPTKLKKLGLTREEYNKGHADTEQ